jgi:hypothetical protein
MKYLKLYENFNNNIEDTLEDIKWVLVEMTERYELLGHEKDYCMLYEISDLPSEEDLESAVGRLQDIGYELVYVGNSPRRDITHTLAKACWIVKSEFCKEWNPLPVVNNGKIPTMEENPIIEDIQKNILLKIWKEDVEPVIDNDRLKKLGMYKYNQIQKVDDWFREYLGPRAKKIIDSILKDKNHHISSGGYEFDIEISYDIKDDEVEIHCEILPGGEVTIIMDDGRTLNLEDAVNDEEIGWEIKGEIHDCIEDYFYKKIRIRDKTGYSIFVESTLNIK